MCSRPPITFVSYMSLVRGRCGWNQGMRVKEAGQNVMVVRDWPQITVRTCYSLSEMQDHQKLVFLTFTEVYNS